MLTRPKHQMSAQPFPLIITSSPGAICINTTPTKEKKSGNPKILDTPSTKKAITKAKRPAINDLIDDLANVIGSMFLQSVKD